MNEPEKIISEALRELPEAVSAPDPGAIRDIAAKRAVARSRTLQTALVVMLIALLGAVAVVVQQREPGQVATTGVETESPTPTSTPSTTAAAPRTSTTTVAGDVTETVPGTFAPDVATPEREPLIPVIPPTASEQPPDTFLMVNEFVVIIEVTGGVERQVATLFDDVPLSQGGRFFESILPLDRNLAIVGLCCEPALGDQSLLNIETGELEGLNFFSSFPSADAGINTIVATGLTVDALAADPLLLRVSEPPLHSPFFSSSGSILQRSEFIGDDLVVITDGEQLVSLDLDGQTVAAEPIAGVRTLAFDERNSMLIALVESGGVINSTNIAADTLMILHPETLEILEEQPLASPAVEVDVRDGWVLLTYEDGSVLVQDINGVRAQEPMFLGATLAEWSVPEAFLEHPLSGTSAPEQAPQTTIPPATPSVSDEFRDLFETVFAHIEAEGYLTTEGEAPFTTSIATTAVAPNDQLPLGVDFGIGVLWQTQVPFGDLGQIEPDRTEETDSGATVHFVTDDDLERSVWFTCREGVVTLQRIFGPDDETILRFVDGLFAAACT